jgi:hypothetical protein
MKQIASKGLLGSFFYLEDGGDTFLQYVRRMSTEYMALYPRITAVEPQILQSTRYDCVFTIFSDSMLRNLPKKQHKK